MIRLHYALRTGWTLASWSSRIVFQAHSSILGHQKRGLGLGHFVILWVSFIYISIRCANKEAKLNWQFVSLAACTRQLYSLNSGYYWARNLVVFWVSTRTTILDTGTLFWGWLSKMILIQFCKHGHKHKQHAKQTLTGQSTRQPGMDQFNTMYFMDYEFWARGNTLHLNWTDYKTKNAQWLTNTARDRTGKWTHHFGSNSCVNGYKQNK